MSDLPDGFQKRGTNTWRLAVVALVGAALVEVVLVVSEGVGEAFAVRKIPDHLAALAVGALLGWMYELLREMNAARTWRVCASGGWRTRPRAPIRQGRAGSASPWAVAGSVR